MLKFTKQDAIIALLVVNLFANVMEISFERETPEALTNNANQFAVFDFKDAIESTIDKEAIKRAKSAEEAEVLVAEASEYVETWLDENLNKHCQTPCLVFKKDVVIGEVVNLNKIFLKEMNEGEDQNEK